MDTLSGHLKAAHPRALATLIRLLGDFDLAEDTLQEAMTRALESWRDHGTPDNPVAWLVTTARRRAIDGLRRRKLEARHVASMLSVVDNADDAMIDAADRLHLNDDMLRLIFTCCHPALAEDTRIALTLKTVAGLSTEEIARAFLVSTRTLEQRITRAKRKIRDARIPYRVPDPSQLAERLHSVLLVIYLIFNEGYGATGDPEFVRPDLCNEAIRLARMLSRLFRAETEVTGLLALLLLQHSRHKARLDNGGNIIPLDAQDRALWDQALIAEGRVLVEKALRRKRPGPYQIQASIAAVHCEAKDADDTDWAQIAELYRTLERFQPSPIVTLNRAVAVARANGTRAGIALLRTIEDSPQMRQYHHYHATMGALLAEDHQASDARAAYRKALSLARNPKERSFIQGKIADIR